MKNKSEEIRAKLNVIFQDIFDNTSIEIDKNTKLSDINNYDSITHVLLVVAIEKEFKVHFNTSEIIKLENTGDILELLEALMP